MGTYDAAVAMVEKLAPQLPPDATATEDARSATPPCVLITHRRGVRDGMCSISATWEVVALAPGPWNADAWRTLDALAAATFAALDVEAYDVVAYRLALDNPPLPAYLFTFTGGVDL